MGVLPLQYADGETADFLGLTGEEEFAIAGVEALNDGTTPRDVTVRAGDIEFQARLRIDTPGEADYLRHGGIMQYVLRSLLDCCFRQKRDVLSMTVVEIHLEEPQVDDADP